MSKPVEFSLEQQFQIKAFNDQVCQMSSDQAKALLRELNTQLMMKETIYRELIKYKWGIEPMKPQQ